MITCKIKLDTCSTLFFIQGLAADNRAMLYLPAPVARRKLYIQDIYITLPIKFLLASLVTAVSHAHSNSTTTNTTLAFFEREGCATVSPFAIAN